MFVLLSWVSSVGKAASSTLFAICSRVIHGHFRGVNSRCLGSLFVFVFALEAGFIPPGKAAD